MDSKLVAMSMIKKGNRNNCINLAEFSLYRVASDRGGKHSIFGYDEGTYNPYFQASN